MHERRSDEAANALQALTPFPPCYGTWGVTDETRTLEIGAVSRTDFVRFAGAAGDFNPLHHDDDAARSAGFPSAIAMGMLTASLASKLVTDWVGVAAVEKLDFRFRAVVLPQQVLSVRGAITERWDDAGTTLGRLDFEVSDVPGEVKLSGTALVRLSAGQ